MYEFPQELSNDLRLQKKDLQKSPEMLEIDGEYPACYPNIKFGQLC